MFRTLAQRKGMKNTGNPWYRCIDRSRVLAMSSGKVFSISGNLSLEIGQHRKFPFLAQVFQSNQNRPAAHQVDPGTHSVLLCGLLSHNLVVTGHQSSRADIGFNQPAILIPTCAFTQKSKLRVIQSVRQKASESAFGNPRDYQASIPLSNFFSTWRSSQFHTDLSVLRSASR